MLLCASLSIAFHVVVHQKAEWQFVFLILVRIVPVGSFIIRQNVISVQIFFKAASPNVGSIYVIYKSIVRLLGKYYCERRMKPNSCLLLRS